ncbi:MAG: diaminopimelate epimerase [Agathobacter sp.]
MKIKFTKMQAYGNDYVYVDAINQNIENPEILAKKISDRHFGVGSDGLVMICPSEICDFRMRIFNPDGTEAEMCGNALRSTAKFVYFHQFTSKKKVTIETLGGRQTVYLMTENGEVTNIHAVIGKPEFLAEKVPVKTYLSSFIDQPLMVEDKIFRASSISWGNPHTVLFVEDVNSFDVEKYGEIIEHMDCFPMRTNVTFAQVINRERIRIREWERGTGETLGCGTGCCSAVIVANTLHMCGRNVDVEQPGGVLHVEWDEENNVHMIGNSHIVYQGEYIL